MKDSTIKELKSQLLEMKAKLESNLDRLKNEMENITTEENINDMEDLASLESDSMHHAALLKQQQHELDEVNHAITKIQEGTYGICEESGHVIPLERLYAKPYARYCLEHAKQAGR